MSFNEFQDISSLEGRMLSFMQLEVNQLNPYTSLKTDPMRNVFLKREFYKLREEFFNGNRDLLMKRKTRLKKILSQEAMNQEKFMKELGYAYISTQP